jgi:hypothetical protein
MAGITGGEESQIDPTRLPTRKTDRAPTGKKGGKKSWEGFPDNTRQKCSAEVIVSSRRASRGRGGRARQKEENQSRPVDGYKWLNL